MHLILQRFTNSTHASGETWHKRIRQVTTVGFALFFAKGMLWVVAAIWLAL